MYVIFQRCILPQVKDFNSFVDRNEANFARSFNRGAKLDRVLRLSEETF